MYSAVCARKGDGRKSNPPDPHRMMIRARVRDHLVRLRDRFPSLKRYEIITTPNNDYRFRIIIPKWRWQRVMHGLVNEQDYDNFKGEVDRAFGTATPEQRVYHDKMLMPIWGICYRFQSRKYGPGIYDAVPEPSKGSKRKAKKRKPKKDEHQTFLLPSTGKAEPVDVEVSPFHEADTIVKTGAEPFPHEQVLLVLDQDNGQEIVVVWTPGFYEDDPRAYADAIQAGVCDVVAHPEFCRMSWGDAKKGGTPIFDPAVMTR
jgi:hypothetical protein